VNRLSNQELRDITGIIKNLSDENLALREKLAFTASQQKTYTLEARKASLKDLEDTFKSHLRDLYDLDKRLSRHMKTLEMFNGNSKLVIRDSEV
jgi:hypothetical protein